MRHALYIFEGLPGQKAEQVGFTNQAWQQGDRSRFDLYLRQRQVSGLKRIVYPASGRHGGGRQHPTVLAQIAQLITCAKQRVVAAGDHYRLIVKQRMKFQQRICFVLRADHHVQPPGKK
ncbi:hypothetical protein D3C76_1026530 [compost metagenome]